MLQAHGNQEAYNKVQQWLLLTRQHGLPCIALQYAIVVRLKSTCVDVQLQQLTRNEKLKRSRDFSDTDDAESTQVQSLICHALLQYKLCMQHVCHCDILGMVLQAAGQTVYMGAITSRLAQGAPSLFCELDHSCTAPRLYKRDLWLRSGQAHYKSRFSVQKSCA